MNTNYEIENGVFIHKKPIIFRGDAFIEPIIRGNVGFGKFDKKTLELIMDETEQINFDRKHKKNSSQCRFIKYETNSSKYFPFESLKFSH